MSDAIQPSKELDVRDLIPIQRHEKLLLLFRNLPVGESFVFINDHDPIPLYYEFRSIHGDVVGWEYLNRGGREWKVKVTRTDASQAREMNDVATLIDLRKIERDSWKQVVFHRYGMMEDNSTMELSSAEDPVEIHGIFVQKFEGRHRWIYLEQETGDYVIRIQKTQSSGLGEEGYAVVNEMDIRPYQPSERHDMFYKAFADIKPGEAFVFINDHDPKPLYYQMKAESEEPFLWEYLEEGPIDWKVRVIKIRI